MVDRNRFKAAPKGVEKWFIDVPPTRVAMKAGTHSIWLSKQLPELEKRADGERRHGYAQIEDWHYATTSRKTKTLAPR
ncbi:hypothetical protein P8936_10455 [Edaphobacter paludis]|uniref:Transposase n=1 Tax=Edaphobacter paludis TaxID=3035702 RepID=A0AAU7CV83_9BACT